MYFACKIVRDESDKCYDKIIIYNNLHDIDINNYITVVRKCLLLNK